MDGFQLPQEDLVKYLGIYFNYKGPDWKYNNEKFTQKAKQALMSMIKFGFNKDTWDPSSKVNIYKMFVRSLMEYGMQIHLYDKNCIEKMEKVQLLAMRIAYGVPWNTSKNAMRRYYYYYYSDNLFRKIN